MAIVEYALDENVAIITLNSGENRFNPDFINAFLNVLDSVEKDTDALTLVVKSAHEKIFSNGIDLEWLQSVIRKQDMKTAKDFFYLLNKLFKKTLMCPMLTIAAMTGHAFAGGAIWPCAFDFRFMRSDRGFFCFPEVDLGIPFMPGMFAIIKKAMPLYKMNEIVYAGSRLTAHECEEYGLVKKACHIDTLMDEALAFAKSLNKKREIILELKTRMYSDIIRIMDVEDVPYIESENYHIS